MLTLDAVNNFLKSRVLLKLKLRNGENPLSSPLWSGQAGDAEAGWNDDCCCLVAVATSKTIYFAKPAQSGGSATEPPTPILILAGRNIDYIYNEAALKPLRIPNASPLAVPHNHQICRARWREFWALRVAPLLNPSSSTALRLSEVGESLDKENIPTMLKSCRDHTVEWMKASKAMYRHEEAIQETVRTLKGVMDLRHCFLDVDKEIVDHFYYY